MGILLKANRQMVAEGLKRGCCPEVASGLTKIATVEAFVKVLLLAAE
jgi:hypothetical protein